MHILNPIAGFMVWNPDKHFFCVWFQMNLLLKEYLTSGDVLEAERCLRDLEVPHFHHELVYEVKKKPSQGHSLKCEMEHQKTSLYLGVPSTV